MAGIELGQGGRLESLTVTPNFPGGSVSASLIIPDSTFSDIKGSLRYSSGSNPRPQPVVGQTAMGATAKGIITGDNFVVGFKQLAFFKFQTAFYAGIKDNDGCIEETTTGLNFTHILDCAPDDQLNSPQAPFYLPRKVVRNGLEFTIEMPDQPQGKLRLQRRNAKRDRLNFLVAFRTQCSFLTYFVVERRDGSHLPINGFEWHYNHDIDIKWSEGEPLIQSSTGSVAFDKKIDNLKPGDVQFDMLANTRLSAADTIVTRFNRAMFAANRRQANGDYSITEFDNFTSNITPDMQSRIVNSAN
jgi:hypothetical protein